MSNPPELPAAPTLLSVLQSFLKAQHSRASLSSELESALSSFLTSTPSLLELAPTSSSTCATEAVRPPNEAELTEILRIGFAGLVEIKDEVEELAAVLRVVFGRNDLADVLTRVEELETERLKQTIQRDQLRRLAVLSPEEDFTEAIAAFNQKRKELAEKINDESLEISGEVADLSAAAESEEP